MAPVALFGSLQSESVVDLVLTVSYIWSFTQYDLDSGIYFLGSSLGNFCDPQNSTYLTFSGDMKGYGGSETYNISLGKAWADGKWNVSTTVQLRAGWTPVRDSGLAAITLSTQRIRANGATLNDNNIILFVVNPTTRGRAQCSPQVATATVVRDDKNRVVITIPK
jgi:hypothetical protein